MFVVSPVIPLSVIVQVTKDLLNVIPFTGLISAGLVNSYQLNPSAYPETSPPPPEPVFVSFHTAEPGDYTITITTVDGSHTATLNVKI